jgi:hypothetical protein
MWGIVKSVTLKCGKQVKKVGLVGSQKAARIE